MVHSQLELLNKSSWPVDNAFGKLPKLGLDSGMVSWGSLDTNRLVYKPAVELPSRTRVYQYNIFCIANARVI